MSYSAYFSSSLPPWNPKQVLQSCRLSSLNSILLFVITHHCHPPFWWLPISLPVRFPLSLDVHHQGRDWQSHTASTHRRVVQVTSTDGQNQLSGKLVLVRAAQNWGVETVLVYASRPPLDPDFIGQDPQWIVLSAMAPTPHVHFWYRAWYPSPILPLLHSHCSQSSF